MFNFLFPLLSESRSLFVYPSVDQHRRRAEVVSSSALYNGASRERFGMHWHDSRVLSPNAPEEIVARRGCSGISSSMGRRVQRLARPAGCVRHWAVCGNRPMRRAQQWQQSSAGVRRDFLGRRVTQARPVWSARRCASRLVVGARAGPQSGLCARIRAISPLRARPLAVRVFVRQKKPSLGDAVFPAVLRRLPGLKVLLRTAL